MKKIFLIVAVAVMGLSTVSCNTAEKDVRECVNGFLTAYFQTDYTTALTFCTDNLAEILEMTLSDREFADEAIKEKVMEVSRKTTYNVLSIDLKSVPGTALIEYEIIAPSSERPIRKTLTATKVDKQWKISGM